MKLLLTALLTSVTLIGCFSYEDAKSQEDEYCRRVLEGSWPAYNKSIDCGEQK